MVSTAFLVAVVTVDSGLLFAVDAPKLDNDAEGFGTAAEEAPKFDSAADDFGIAAAGVPGRREAVAPFGSLELPGLEEVLCPNGRDGGGMERGGAALMLRFEGVLLAWE